MKKNPKHPTINPNDWLPAEVAKSFEVVGWKFGHMVHFPKYAFLGHPNGRVNLKDIKPKYAEQLVAAGFPYLRKKVVTAPTETEPAKPKKQGKTKD